MDDGRTADCRGPVGNTRARTGLVDPEERGPARRAGAGRQRSVERAVRAVHLGRSVRRAVRADGRPGEPGHAVAHAGGAQHRSHRTGQPLRRGRRQCIGNRDRVRDVARRLSRQREAGAGSGGRRVGARFARRARHDRHRAEHARARDEARRLRRARRLRQRHTVLALVRRPVGEDAAAVPAPDASVRRVRLHAGPAARRLRRRRARQHAEPRPRRNRGDHGRIRRADAARRREQVRATSGRPAVLARTVPGPERARGRVDRRRVRGQRLVRRADARRRGRARDGSRRERPLLRRRKLLRRRPDGPVGPDRPRQQGVDRDQLVGLADVLRRQRREPRLSRGSRDNRRLRGGLQAGRRAGDRVHVLLRRRG